MLISRGLARLSMLPLLAAVAAAACTGPQPRVDNTTSLTQSPTPSPAASPSPSVPPAAQAAVTSYLNYNTALRNAQQDPPTKLADRLSPTEDYTKYSFDPETERASRIILRLTSTGHAVRGVPPKPNVTVLSVAPNAQ